MYWQTAGVYCGIGYIQVMLILGIGIGILRILQIKIESIFKLIFYALCTGIYVWILVTSLIYTQGKTILLGSLPLIIALTWQFKSNKDISKQIASYFYFHNSFFKFIAISLGIWIWTSLLNIYCISLNGQHLYLPHFDILHSIEISQNLQQNGTETYYYWQKGSNTFPYHYAEIWLHAGIQALWHTQKTWTWQGIVVPLLQFTLVIGLLSIAEHYQKEVNRYWISIACGFLLFQGWLNISLPHFDAHFDFTRYVSMIGATKFLVVGIVCIVYLLSNDKVKHWTILLLPIFSIITLPAVVTLIALTWIKTKQKQCILGIGLLIIWIFGFYFITGTHNSSFSDVLVSPSNRDFRQNQAYSLILAIIFYLPTLFWVQEKTILIQLLVIFVIGYALFLGIYWLYDSYQFLVLFGIPFAWAHSWVVIVKNKKKIMTTFLYVIIAFSLIQTLLYKKDFQRTAIDNAWINEIYTYLITKNVIQQGAALWYYDIRQSHVFCWKEKNIKITSLLAQPTSFNFDKITRESLSDTLSNYMVQKNLLFHPKSNKKLETQIFSFCKQNKLHFLVYPTELLSFDEYQADILCYFESKKDKLNCIVFEP